MFDSSDGISVVIYVVTATGEVMDGNSLLASIQNGSDIYKNYGFSSVVVERVSGGEPQGGGGASSSGGLSTGAIAGIVVAALLVTAAVVVTAAFLFYRIRKTGLYKVDGLAGGYDNPTAERFFEFGINTSDDEVKKNPLFEEAEGKL
jgi:hypothetical protein